MVAAVLVCRERRTGATRAPETFAKGNWAMPGLRFGLVIALVGGVVGQAAAYPLSVLPRESVHFEFSHSPAANQSVYVLGDIPELGGGDMTQAVKLVTDVNRTSGVWAADIAIPQGTDYSYAYVLRTDTVSLLSNPTNGASIAGPFVGVTADPVPATVDATVYAYVGEANDVLFDTWLGSVERPLLPLPGMPAVIGAALPGRPAGAGISGDLGNNNIGTPLEVIFSLGQHTYPYQPPMDIENALQFEDFVIPTALIQHTRTIDSVSGRGCTILLPRGYSQNSSKQYPVLYMHDGQNVFDPGGPFGSWSANAAVRKGVRDGRMAELIVVAIDNSSDRSAEYVGSLNDEYNAFIIDELMPYVNANYRTLSGPANTGIAGSSFGGVASVALGVFHSDVFGRVGAFSTSFWATTLDEVQLANGDVPMSTRFYLDAGDISDGTEATIAARDALIRTGRTLHDNLHFTIGYDQAHNEAAWSERLPDALEYLFPVSDEPDGLTALPAPIVGDVDGNGCVDSTDLSLLLGAFGSAAGDAAYNTGLDVDVSGAVDSSDLSLLLANFGAGDCG